jgi:nicotinamidase-related amidase
MNRALLVIDVQNEYFNGQLPVTYPPDSLPNILNVMRTAAEHNIPIAVVQHTETVENTPIFQKDSEAWQLHPAVAQLPYDLLIEKNLPGSFTGTALEDWLRKQAIETLVISGYMTQMCCDTTARQAIHLGFAIEFLSDATGTLAFSNKAGSATAEELHRTVLVIQDSFESKVVTAAEWIDSLKE